MAHRLPQRDEQLGWTGDAAVFTAAPPRRIGTSRFFPQVAGRPCRLDKPPGWTAVCTSTPGVNGQGSGGAAVWDAAVTIPWTSSTSFYGERIFWNGNLSA